jgi:hypothetical protein
MTPDKSQAPTSDPLVQSPTKRVSPGALSLLVGLAAAGVTYGKSADEATAAVVGVVVWLLARTSIGQTLVRVSLAIAGLWLGWVVWTFFSELSKSYR